MATVRFEMKKAKQNFKEINIKCQELINSVHFKFRKILIKEKDFVKKVIGLHKEYSSGDLFEHIILVKYGSGEDASYIPTWKIAILKVGNIYVFEVRNAKGTKSMQFYLNEKKIIRKRNKTRIV